jgi:hypothetical protein
MSHVETKLGLTNIVKRLAYHYLVKGVGVYPLDDPFYDQIVVRELYPWMPNPENQNEYGGGVVVELFKDNRRVRFVEFGIRFTGGGGDIAIRLLEEKQIDRPNNQEAEHIP